MQKEDVLLKFEECGYTLLDKDKIQSGNRDIKYDCIDSEGFMYSLNYRTLADKRYNGNNRVVKYNPYSIYNIQKIINDKGSSTKVLSKTYLNQKKKLELQCGKCDKIYEATYGHLFIGCDLFCKQCIKSQPIQKNRRTHKLEDVIPQIESKGYTLVRYNTAHDLTIQDKDGYLYDTILYNVNADMQFDKFGYDNIHTADNIVKYIENNNIPTKLLDIESVKNKKIHSRAYKFTFECCECGKPFKNTIQKVLYENICRCTYCTKKKSKLEFTVEQYLKERNIHYILQKRFEDCRDKRTLPFDFYLPDYNCCIEVNGDQHYREHQMFSQSLSERQRVDKIKREYCNTHNITLLEIPHWNIFNNGKLSNTYKNKINSIIKM